MERGGQGDGRRVGASPAQGRHVVVLGDALEPGDDRHLAVLNGSGDALGNHADDLRGAEAAIGLDARLRTRVGASLNAQLIDGHRQQRHRDAFARGQEDIHLALGGLRGQGCRSVKQVVGRVAHGRYDDDDAVPRVVRVHDALGDALHGLGVGDGGTAVLLHNQCH